MKSIKTRYIFLYLFIFSFIPGVLCIISFLIPAHRKDAFRQDLDVAHIIGMRDYIAVWLGELYMQDGKLPESIEFVLSDKNWFEESQSKIKRQIQQKRRERHSLNTGLDKILTYQPVFLYVVATPPESGIVAILEYGPNKISPLQMNDLEKIMKMNAALIESISRRRSTNLFADPKSYVGGDKKEFYAMMESLVQSLDGDDNIGIYDLNQMTIVCDDEGTTHGIIQPIIDNISWPAMKADYFFSESKN